MVEALDLMHRLRTRVRLPSATLAAVESLLRDGQREPGEILRQAGLSADQISSVLEHSEVTAAAEPKHASPANVSTISEEPSVDDLIGRLVDITPRFELQGEIARGAMGRILAGWDLHLGRPVAIKVLRKSSARDLDRVRFLEEAQVTGQLQHPSIMPVYELGRLRDQVAFVMRRIEGRSLKDVISGLRRGNEEFQEQYGHMRLLNVFHQLCLAVGYAHQRGVVHRDLKPSNVMLGDFGEVVLLDWGLCKVVGAATRSTRSTSERWKTVHGQIIGTPAYMAPEQAMGLIDQVDARTDVYGLGAILYHLLTFRPPFTGKSNREIVNRVLKEEVRPPSRRSPNREIPDELERICMRSLARDPDHRFPNARALADAVQRYLDGPKVPSATAESLPRVEAEVQRGLAALARHQTLLEDAALASDEYLTARAHVDPGDPPDAKMSLWAAERRFREIKTAISDVFGEAVYALSKAVARDPDHSQARSQLCDLFLSRLEAARSRDDAARAAYYRRMLSEYDDGRFAAVVADEGSLHAEIQPEGAQVWLWVFEEEARQLVASSPRNLGSAPVKLDRLRAGIYRMTAQAANRETLNTTVVIEPGRCTRLRMRMLPAKSIPQGFVHVPAGTFRFGTTRDAYLPPMEQALPDFLIGVFPVTAVAYLAFLNHLQAAGARDAARRVPRDHEGRDPLWKIGPDGLYEIPDSLGWTDYTPIVGVAFEDAVAYCRWLKKQTGMPYRLPSEEEWEKAARGTEGRIYPWGNAWEPSYAACPSTCPGPWPPPAGQNQYDCSPYGACDFAGGVREWTATRGVSRTACIIVRGGSFATGDDDGRPLWTRETVHSQRTAPDLGFRLALDVSLINQPGRGSRGPQAA